MNTKRNIYHITPARNEWRVVKREAKRALSVHKTREQAIKEGWRLARANRPSQLIVHRRDGSVRLERFYELKQRQTVDGEGIKES